jgi:hypothetical protein
VVPNTAFRERRYEFRFYPRKIDESRSHKDSTARFQQFKPRTLSVHDFDVERKTKKAGERKKQKIHMNRKRKKKEDAK